MPSVVVEQHLQEVLGRELLVALRERQVCADWMKPRARSVYFSKFMFTPSRHGRPTRSVDGTATHWIWPPEAAMLRHMVWPF